MQNFYSFIVLLDSFHLCLFDLGLLGLGLCFFYILLNNALNIKYIKNSIAMISLFLLVLYSFIFILYNVYDNTYILSEKGWFDIGSPFDQFKLIFWFEPISVMFVLISILLVLICLYIHRYSFYQKRFYILLFLLEIFLITIFLTTNSFLFYICFECSLIPMFIIVGVWGSKERKIRAGYLFLMYSVIGSFLFLTSLIYILVKYNITDIVDIQYATFSYYEELFLWLGCFFAFAVKTPLVPFHLWLPEAHVEAPTAGSVMLAGILLKLGSYGFIRFNFTLFPTASSVFASYVFLFGILGVIYACSSAFLQFDIKKIIAYSSVAHMSVITLGLFTMNNIGFIASVISMIAHSFVASGLFLAVGILYEKFQTRNIFYYGGLFRVMPVFSVFFFILCFANIAFPGTLSFIGEFFILQGIIKVSVVASILLVLTFVLSSAYVLFMMNRILFTNLKLLNVNNVLNTNFYDILPITSFKSAYRYQGDASKYTTTSFLVAFVILTFLTIFYGIKPIFLINLITMDACYSFFSNPWGLLSSSLAYTSLISEDSYFKDLYFPITFSEIQIDFLDYLFVFLCVFCFFLLGGNLKVHAESSHKIYFKNKELSESFIFLCYCTFILLISFFLWFVVIFFLKLFFVVLTSGEFVYNFLYLIISNVYSIIKTNFLLCRDYWVCVSKISGQKEYWLNIYYDFLEHNPLTKIHLLGLFFWIYIILTPFHFFIKLALNGILYIVSLSNNRIYNIVNNPTQFLQFINYSLFVLSLIHVLGLFIIPPYGFFFIVFCWLCLCYLGITNLFIYNIIRFVFPVILYLIYYINFSLALKTSLIVEQKYNQTLKKISSIILRVIDRLEYQVYLNNLLFDFFDNLSVNRYKYGFSSLTFTKAEIPLESKIINNIQRRSFSCLRINKKVDKQEFSLARSCCNVSSLSNIGLFFNSGGMIDVKYVRRFSKRTTAKRGLDAIEKLLIENQEVKVVVRKQTEEEIAKKVAKETADALSNEAARYVVVGGAGFSAGMLFEQARKKAEEFFTTKKAQEDIDSAKGAALKTAEYYEQKQRIIDLEKRVAELENPSKIPALDRIETPVSSAANKEASLKSNSNFSNSQSSASSVKESPSGEHVELPSLPGSRGGSGHASPAAPSSPRSPGNGQFDVLSNTNLECFDDLFLNFELTFPDFCNFDFAPLNTLFLCVRFFSVVLYNYFFSFVVDLMIFSTNITDMLIYVAQIIKIIIIILQQSIDFMIVFFTYLVKEAQAFGLTEDSSFLIVFFSFIVVTYPIFLFQKILFSYCRKLRLLLLSKVTSLNFQRIQKSFEDNEKLKKEA